jgi:hypothetical protein
MNSKLTTCIAADPTDDGPEANIIAFFIVFPEGLDFESFPETAVIARRMLCDSSS